MLQHRVATQREGEGGSGFRGVREREGLDEVPLRGNPHGAVSFRKRKQGVPGEIGDPSAVAGGEDRAAHRLGVVILYKDFQERKSIRKGGGYRFRKVVRRYGNAEQIGLFLNPSESARNSKQTQP